MILLTSFRRAAENEATFPGVTIWSSAVYQPNWLPQRPKAEWMDIRPSGDTWIRPREYLNMDRPLDGYFAALAELYESRRSEVEAWVEQVIGTPTWVCCWCPYDKAAKRQLGEWGTFVCHTAAVGRFLEQFPLSVVYDKDREKMVMPDGQA